MKKFLFSTIIVSIFAGIFLLFFLLPYNPIIKNKAECFLKNTFERSFHCKVSNAHLKSFNLFGINLIGENVSIQNPDSGEWYWNTKKIKVFFSWFDLIRTGKFGLELTLFGFEGYSCINEHSLAITHHLQHMLAGVEGAPIVLKKVSIQKGSCIIVDPDHAIQFNCNVAGELQIKPNNLKVTAYFNDGLLHENQQLLIELPQASCRVDIIHNEINGNFQGTLVPAQIALEDKQFIINASWQQNNGSFVIHSKDNSCFAQTTTLCFDKSGFTADLIGQIPFSLMQELLFKSNTIKVSGTSTFNLHCNYETDFTISGTLKSNQCTINEIDFGAFDATISRYHNCWMANATWQYAWLGQFNGALEYNDQLSVGKIKLYNNTMLDFASFYWKIHPYDCCLEIDINKNNIKGNYQIHALHDKLNDLSIFRGNFIIDEQQLFCNGFWDELPYFVHLQMPNFHLAECHLKDQKNQSLVFFNSTSDHDWNGIISLKPFNDLMQSLLNYDLRADGTINVKIESDNDKYSVFLSLDKGIIYAGQPYNYINGLNAKIILDAIQKQIILDEIQLAFNKGKINFNHGIISWPDNQKAPFMHVPIVISKLFFNCDKNLLIVVSGDVLCKYNEEGLGLAGKIWCDKGQLNKNILSATSIKELSSKIHQSNTNAYPNIKLDLVIENKKAFHIKTSFLTADAYFSGNLKGDLNDPQFSGTLSLGNGVLAFPYKPLFLNTAQVYFGNQGIIDPSFELIAKGKVNKYSITLRGSGSLNNPLINFQSTPPLEEDQIIMLLLAGSEKNSIALTMPTFLIQNVHHIIFGPEQSHTKLTNYFQKLLKPLKNIRIVPSFTDQTGRGGFRGALEIDLNDQLRAMIQKNFSQPEDTKFEVEYLVSDDLVLRGIKDEHGDLGGEVEMRWKF